MRIYAERPARAARQLLADVVALGWVVAWIVAGVTIHGLLLALQSPARRLVTAGETVARTFDDAARTAGGIPFVGDDLARSLGSGTEAGASLAAAGQEHIDTIAALAVTAGTGIAVLGALPVVLVWLPARIRFARAAAAAVAAREIGPELLALRALTNRPVRELLAVVPDPVAAWRSADPHALDGFAELELRALGLRGRSRAPLPAGAETAD
ncbi:MAG: hypothetical protein JWP64_4964 [Pseudonocardia sp.]|jgi:uncharacterized membrane protein YciS (DUF1049 family)|uniref:hypothetical protein n=1 Tax=Pseudonocardia sp. TaxID=60912 RepID=UPI0026094435|nr:hypothetical protein [Pseudonocardia sp.]MCU1630015.1 hypothetical protein [Pseudonocardia sp.]MDT7698890.1 hypothetical protein [Pseudonocardiales bacterium]